MNQCRQCGCPLVYRGDLLVCGTCGMPHRDGAAPAKTEAPAAPEAPQAAGARPAPRKRR